MSVTDGISSLATSTADVVNNYVFKPGTSASSLVGDVTDFVKEVTGASVGGVSTEAVGDFAELINLQIQVQQEMQTVTMVSNIEKSKHESKMAALRNVRTS